MNCSVCNAIPACYRYGAIVCGACKAFFVRWCAVESFGKKERCYLGGNCQITSTKRPCKPCRYEKCLRVGMSLPGHEVNTMTDEDRGNDHRSSSNHRKLTKYNGKRSHSGASSHSFQQNPPTDQPTEEEITDPCSSASTESTSSYLCQYQIGSLSFTPSTTATLMPISIRPSVITRLPSPPIPKQHHQQHVISLLSQSQDNSLAKSTEFRILQAVLTAPLLRNLLKSQHAVYAALLSAVQRASTSVFGEDLKVSFDFMERSIEMGTIPHQPQTSLTEMKQQVQRSVQGFVYRMFDFALCLPGFANLHETDRVDLFQTKWTVFWMIYYSGFWRNDEFFCLLGDGHSYHYGRYWLTMMNANEVKRVSFIFSFAETLQSIGLDQTEMFLLLVLSLLNTDHNVHETSSHLSLLYKQYLDVMLHAVSWRRSSQAGLDVIYKLDHILSRIKLSEKLNINHLDFSKEISLSTNRNYDMFSKSNRVINCLVSPGDELDSFEIDYDPFVPMNWNIPAHLT